MSDRHQHSTRRIVGIVTWLVACWMLDLSAVQVGITKPIESLVMGTVVNQADQGVASALVTLRSLGTGEVASRVLTNPQGRFVFDGLAAGTFELTAAKRGFAEGSLGRLWPDGPATVLTLRDGDRVGSLNVRLWEHAAIAGTVVDESGEPAVGVSVRLIERHGQPASLSLGRAETDDRGRYRIGSIRQGEYLAVVPSMQMAVPASVLDAFVHSQTPAGSVSQQKTPFAASRMGSALDNLVTGGRLRVGEHWVRSSLAMPAPYLGPANRMYAVPTTYYPGARSQAEAVPIVLRAGEERVDIDFRMIPIPTWSVSGAISGPADLLSVGLSMIPIQAELGIGSELQTATTWSDSKGRFTFFGVPSGRYAIRTIRAPELNRSVADVAEPALLWAESVISVDADTQDVSLTLRPGFRIAGRLTFEGQNPPSAALKRRLQGIVERPDGSPLDAPPLGRFGFAEDGRFLSREIPPGFYRIRLENLPSGWTVKAIRLGGREVIDSPVRLDSNVSELALILTDQPTQITGTVSVGSGLGDSNATIVVFPSQKEKWSIADPGSPRFRAIRPDREGKYEIRGLPAGEYFVLAVIEDDLSMWRRPDVLSKLASSASHVVLHDGETRGIALTAVKFRR